ncbi:AglZ/HisF2 family acetamidino modification protein [Hippea jasoniae]|uniref:AglZ/HisF2 family acetamidino modification protein n=1 Tax=Hippea jasoniae TaxID=944479 RepID=UPI00055602FC|nr:AglZ/HisF2 family acetamidino modification protein [Hippea jasoniae]
MIKTRIIPVLLMKNRGLYKGIKFKNHKYVGDPINTVRIFNEKEVDELIIFDIEASKANKSIDFDYLKEVVSEAFMPIGYGGGIKSVKDAENLFKIGIEKVILNTHAILNFQLIKELVKNFGSQSVVFSLDYKKTFFNGYKVFIKSGTKKTSYKPEDIASIMEDLGAGEIILNDIDRDGTFNGYNIEMIKEISSNLSIPLIACGGARNLKDFKMAKDAGASACAAGSMFVFHMPHRAVVISYPRYEELKKVLGEN